MRRILGNTKVKDVKFMNNRIQEIMDLEHFKTLTPIQEQVLNRKNKNRDIIGVSKMGIKKA